MKSLKKIENYQGNITKFKKQIKELEQEVAQEKSNLDDLNESYQSLVVSGEVVKADKLYLDIEDKDKQYKAKAKRLKTMKDSLKRVIKDNCRNMSIAFEDLTGEYREAYSENYKSYQEAVKQAREKKQEIEAYNQKYQTERIKLSRYIDHMLKEHDIHPREFTGNVNALTPFNVESK